MSDVSGIPNMGFGGGNFFAPQFSYNPQMSAGQASAAYMPEIGYSQNITNNLYGGGANAGYGRQTDYYSALGASYGRQIQYSEDNPYRYGGVPASLAYPGASLSGGYTTGAANMPSYDTGPNFGFTSGGAGAIDLSGGGGRGLFSGDAGGFSSGGGSSPTSSGGFSGGIYGGDSFGSGGSSPTSSGGGLNWSHIFDFGGSGPRNDPAPNMAMPGGLNAPMTMPQQTQPQQSSINWNNVGAAAGAGSSMPYTSGIEPDQTGGMTMPGGPGSPTGTPSAPSYGSLGGDAFGAGDNAPSYDRIQQAFHDLSTAQGGTDLSAPTMPNSQKLLGYEPQQWPAEFDPNTFVSPANRYDQFQGPGQGGGGDTDLSSSNKSAEKIAEEARARLADLIGSPETEKVVEEAKKDTGDAAIPLPRERPEGADVERPPADVAPQGLTYLQGKGPGDLKGVNARFAKALEEFTKEYNASQGDYSIALRSGLRTGAGERFHKTGEAMDINLIDRKTGERLNDYQTRDPTVFKAYQDNANQFHTFLEKNYPDLAEMHRWGGYFSGGPGKYGASDIMHHDLAGRVGMGGGSWQGGLNQASADAYGLPTGGGTNTPWPQFTFNWNDAPIKDAPPIQQTYKSGSGADTRVYQLAEDGTRIPVPIHSADKPYETTEYDPFRGTQLGGIRERSGLNEGQEITRPPGDIPSGTPFVNDGTPFGPPAPAGYADPAAAPVKHSGLELARANIDTPIEKIAMERGGQKAVDQINSMAMGMTPRQLMQSYGGLFMSRAEPLFSSLGITRQDFEKALTMPQTKQDLKMRFGEGDIFGPYPAYTGPEAAPSGGNDVYSQFRQSTNVEDRRGEQFTPEQQGPATAAPGAAPVPGFFGNDEEIANRVIPPGQLTPRWNEFIYEGTDRPTMARDESLGPDPNPFTGFRPSENVDDRRFDPALTDEQKKTFQGNLPYHQYQLTNEQLKDAADAGRTTLAKQLGADQISNLEANATMRGATQGARAPRATGDGTGYDDIFAANDAAAAEPTSMRDFPSPANDYSKFQQPASRADLAKTLTFGGGFSPSPEPRQGGVGPEVSLSPEHMQTMAEVESHGNPALHDKGSQYKGLYQLNDTEFRKYGGTGDIYDYEQNYGAASRKMIAEGQRAQDILGRELTPVEQYMVHQQGLAGTLAHLANPDELAWKNFQSASGRSDAGAKKAIWDNLSDDMKAQFGNDVNNITSRDFINLWNEQYADKAVAAGLPRPGTGGYFNASP